jgi:endonuclease-3 related protein
MSQIKKILSLYSNLLLKYGPRGWWPILSRANQLGFDEKGYHPSIYDYPKSSSERYEVVVGAILTQNTAWKNVEKALSNLFYNDLLSPEKISNSEQNALAQLIRPAGYYNQKAIKLKHITEWFASNDRTISKISAKIRLVKVDSKAYEEVMDPLIKEAREDLLKVHGVGPETADSILLYAYHLPIFVVDSYTKRIFQHHKICKLTGNHTVDYYTIQDAVHSAFIEYDPASKEKFFNEFHALIVEEGKNFKNSKKSVRD